MFAVTFVHVVPPSRVTCTNPSSVPTQIRPARRGDSPMVMIVQCISAPVFSADTPTSAGLCFAGSLVERSGLITPHVSPRLTLLKSLLPPKKIVFELCGEMSIGELQLKRYRSP